MDWDAILVLLSIYGKRGCVTVAEILPFMSGVGSSIPIVLLTDGVGSSALVLFSPNGDLDGLVCCVEEGNLSTISQSAAFVSPSTSLNHQFYRFLDHIYVSLY